MYYLFLGRKNDFDSPESLIVEYQNYFFQRGEHTDWFLLEEKEARNITSGKDNRYYSIEKSQFERILSSWGGSRYGYKNQNIHHETDNEGYGDSYFDEDEY